MPAGFGKRILAFQLQPLSVLPPGYTTLLDFFKLFVDNRFMDMVVDHFLLAYSRKNQPEVQRFITANAIRTIQAVMFLTGYLTLSN